MRNVSTHFLSLMVAIAIALTSIGCHRDGLSREERRARQAAERYYGWLKRGRIDKFVSHIAYADSMSAAYRDEMAVLMDEHLASLRQQHGALTDVKAIGQVVADSLAHVYLQLSFADSTSEEVGLPMVKVGGTWLMQ